MDKLSSAALEFCFSCNFLWSGLSLFHYLDERVATESINALQLKWNDLAEELAEWLVEEWYYPLDNEKIDQEHRHELFETTQELADAIIVYFATALGRLAAKKCQENPNLSKSEWLYYCYCLFLQHILSEFNRILQAQDDLSDYYQHYRKSVKLFDDLVIVLEQERPFGDRDTNINSINRQSLWAELDELTSKLGAQWRQAVLYASRNKILPDFIDNSA